MKGKYYVVMIFVLLIMLTSCSSIENKLFHTNVGEEYHENIITICEAYGYDYDIVEETSESIVYSIKKEAVNHEIIILISNTDGIGMDMTIILERNNFNEIKILDGIDGHYEFLSIIINNLGYDEFELSQLITFVSDATDETIKKQDDERLIEIMNDTGMSYIMRCVEGNSINYKTGDSVSETLAIWF